MLGFVERGLMAGEGYVVRVTVPTPLGPFTLLGAGAPIETGDEPELDQAAIELAHRELARNPVTALTLPG